MNFYSRSSWDQKIDLKSQADVTDYIVAPSTYPSGALPINGSGVLTSGSTPRYPTSIFITSIGNNVGVYFEILGLDDTGTYTSETILGTNATSAESIKLFSAIYSITSNINSPSNVEAGIFGDLTLFCASQAAVANVPLFLNGPVYSGDYTIGNPAFVTITCAANELLNSFTINGQDQAGRPYSITVPGGNADTITIPVPFYNIKQGQITMLNTASGNVSVGISSQTSTVWIPLDKNRTQFNDMLVVSLTNASNLNYSVDYTDDNALNGVVPIDIYEDTTLINQTASNQAVVPAATNFCRLRFNSWTSGEAIFQVSSAGSQMSFKNF